MGGADDVYPEHNQPIELRAVSMRSISWLNRKALWLSLLIVVPIVAAPPGLQIGEDGTILRNGVPCHGVGINYMDAFTRCLEDPENTSYREGFATLKRYDIPFVRLNFGGFYPVAWKMYQEDPDTYFALMDGVVKAAEENGIGLVPSLFWWSACIPDLVGEPRNRWGDPKSKTHTFMRRYVTEVVSRYKDSPAIWAWEFGNEYNLAVDLPNAEKHRPWTHVSKGCPADRSAEDDLNSAMMGCVLTAFGEAVRAIDPHRPITSGNSLPRISAHHQRVEGSWMTDSRVELQENLAFTTPDPLNMISVHIYPHARDKRFGAERVGYDDLIALIVEGADASRKGLFVGEFGPPPDNEAPWTHESAYAEGERLMAALLQSEVQLAAFWVFDFSWQEGSFNVTEANHRKGYLKLLQAANQTMARRSTL